MSEKAYQSYEDALTEQYTRNQARRILTRVDEARKSPHSAGLRWPFELLQNALDTGPRIGKSVVTVRCRREPNRVVFEHDGAPFTSQELAALLSGGSSKEYDSDATTGRFGTGFLVTHVLAERTRLHGLLQVVDAGCEYFDLTLDRGGTEDAILANIKESQKAIREAVSVPDPAREPSAVFEYACDKDDSWLRGLKELKRALPYLYATRQKLGSVEIQDGMENIEKWTPSEVERVPVEDGYLVRRSISVTRSSSQDTLPPRDICIYRFSVADASADALVLVEHTEDGLNVCLPDKGAPRVFCDYPLRDSGFLPMNLILNGKFDLDQERRCFLMSSHDKVLLEQGLSAAVLAVRYAIDQRWRDAHWLAFTECPPDVLEGGNIPEPEWLKEHLSQFAKRIARIPIVDCETGFLPAVTDEGESADFIIPRLLDVDPSDATTVERLWPLVGATETLVPPRKELAPDWTEIAEGWSSLGVSIRRICVANLAESVRSGAETLEQLRVQGDPYEWLAIFLDIVGECWKKRAGSDLSPLEGMIPNQNRRLCSPNDLMRDEGVSEKLKDICEGMGYNIREQLLFRGFEEIARSHGLRNVTETIKKTVSTDTAEDKVVLEAVKRMRDALPEDKHCGSGTIDVQQAIIRLLGHLWNSDSKDASLVAQQVPLVASDGCAVRWSKTRLFMGPIRAWPKLAQRFADAYPPKRVLSDLYAGSEDENIPNVTSALSEWGIAYTDPIIQVSVPELKDRRLEALSGVDTTGIVVREEQLSQIALLQPEVLNRCQENIEQARALFGLVLCYAARHDSGWKERRDVMGRKAGEDISVSIGGALWLADLKVRAWVPVPGEDGKPQKVVATAATLKELLDPKWLRDNDDAIRLLSEGFDFDQLELRLLGIAESDQDRQELRDSLAGLLETGGANPDFYTKLATDIQARQEKELNVKRCRKLGLGVQKAIGTALEREGLDVTLVDKGFDFKVELRNSDVIEDVGIRFEVGSYLVEVKATTTGQVRLTPLQAETAGQEPARYVLCVVDLRQVPEVDLAREEWAAEYVDPLAYLVSDIGSRAGKTYNWVDEAISFDVGIRNESALRYEVPPRIWGSGMSIGDWVKAIKQ